MLGSFILKKRKIVHHLHHHHHLFFFFFFFFFFFSVRIPGTITALKGPSFKGGPLPIGKLRIGIDKVESLWGEGEGFGEGKRGLSPESPLFPSPIFPPRTK
ncbi:hypothetical protein [Bilophila wadsworthia]|uniref:hypothetical protein n=1 Tax=Bilophila wadsworthia TaxID=35833 RepID=UPI003990DBF5